MKIKESSNKHVKYLVTALILYLGSEARDSMRETTARGEDAGNNSISPTRRAALMTRLFPNGRLSAGPVPGGPLPRFCRPFWSTD